MAEDGRHGGNVLGGASVVGPTAHAAHAAAAHLGQVAGAVVLVEDVIGGVLQVLHVQAEEGAQLDEVAVALVLDVHQAPGVLAAANAPPAAGHVDAGGAADDGKRDRLANLPVLDAVQLVLVAVALGDLEDGDAVLLKLLEDLLLEEGHLRGGQGVRLGDYGHDVDLAGEALHELDVQLGESKEEKE